MSERMPKFETARNKVLKAFAQAGQQFEATTKPYRSTGTILYTVVQAQDTNKSGFLVATAGQSVDLFSYGQGSAQPGYFPPDYGAQHTANESDTNLSQGRQTNANEEFVIEGVSASSRNIRIHTNANILGASDNAFVTQALTGQLPIVDPGALIAPPQCVSPYNLEDVLFEAIAPHSKVEFIFDKSKTFYVGQLDQMPEGGAKSHLRAHGNAETGNRYRIPEGYIWRRQGQPGGEFVARITLAQTVVVPFSTVTLPAGASPNVPKWVALDFVLRLHGLSAKTPSPN